MIVQIKHSGIVEEKINALDFAEENETNKPESYSDMDEDWPSESSIHKLPEPMNMNK